MGIARFATLSDGSYLEPLNSFKKTPATAEMLPAPHGA
jgi:hypothetical protein